MKPCKHGHIDGARHIPCPHCRIEVLEQEVSGLHDQLAIALTDIVFKGARIGELEAQLRTPPPPRAEPCNLPFERVPQHEADPGYGPVPPRPVVTELRPIPQEAAPRADAGGQWQPQLVDIHTPAGPSNALVVLHGGSGSYETLPEPRDER